MADTSGWLIDKSALARLAHCSETELWRQRVIHGLIHISTVTLLEVGFSARSESDWIALQGNPPITDMPTESVTPRVETRALEVQQLLARAGTHRAPGPADLLIAAIAEIAGLSVLHVDKDFELIAEVTGQPMDRLRGNW